jgi:hypothetical protein
VREAGGDKREVATSRSEGRRSNALVGGRDGEEEMCFYPKTLVHGTVADVDSRSKDGGGELVSTLSEAGLKKKGMFKRLPRSVEGAPMDEGPVVGVKRSGVALEEQVVLVAKK